MNGASYALETPAALIEWNRVRANAARVAAYCAEHGIDWRPHVKTHKSVEVARLQIDSGAKGLTVATPHEAEVMSEVTDDLLLAHPPVGAVKVERVVGLPDRVDLMVGLDSEEALRPLAAAARGRARVIGVLIEADVGMGRVGMPGIPDIVALAALANELEGVRYDGLMFYPGHIRIPVTDQGPHIETLAARLDDIVEALSREGLDPRIVSGGSTPTLWRSHQLPAVTEVRPGTCIYNDRDILTLDACSREDLAYSVLATVVSNAVPGQAVIDAGSKALAKEPFRAGGGGFGTLREMPDVVVSALSEEHGILDLSGTDWRPRVGDQVRVVPNHVCVSVNLQDRLWADHEGHLRPIALEGRGRHSKQLHKTT